MPGLALVDEVTTVEEFPVEEGFVVLGLGTFDGSDRAELIAADADEATVGADALFARK